MNGRVPIHFANTLIPASTIVVKAYLALYSLVRRLGCRPIVVTEYPSIISTAHVHRASFIHYFIKLQGRWNRPGTFGYIKSTAKTRPPLFHI